MKRTFLAALLALAWFPAAASGAAAPDAVMVAGTVVDWISAHMAMLLIGVPAIAGMLAQAAAAFNLNGLGRIAAWLPPAIQWLAGNWGYASNAVEILDLYETDGPDAALARLAALASDRRPPAAS